MGMFRPSAKTRDLPRPAVGAEVLEDLDGVARSRPLGGGEGILDRLGDPEPAPGVEGDVDRLVDVGLGGDELDLEAGRQVEALPLFLGRPRGGRRDVFNLGGPGPGPARGPRTRPGTGRGLSCGRGRVASRPPRIRWGGPDRRFGNRLRGNPAEEADRRPLGVVQPDLAVALARVVDGRAEGHPGPASRPCSASRSSTWKMSLTWSRSRPSGLPPFRASRPRPAPSNAYWCSASSRSRCIPRVSTYQRTVLPQSETLISVRKSSRPVDHSP